MYNENDYIEYRKDCLAHHGVKGQKWGVRRLKEKIQKEKLKAKIAEQKQKQKDPYEDQLRFQKQSNKNQIKFEEKRHEFDQQDAKEKTKNGKSIIKTLLVGGVLATAAISSILVKHKNNIAEGQARASVMMQKSRNTNAVSRAKTSVKVASIKSRGNIPLTGATRSMGLRR